MEEIDNLAGALAGITAMVPQLRAERDSLREQTRVLEERIREQTRAYKEELDRTHSAYAELESLMEMDKTAATERENQLLLQLEEYKLLVAELRPPAATQEAKRESPSASPKTSRKTPQTKVEEDTKPPQIKEETKPDILPPVEGPLAIVPQIAASDMIPQARRDFLSTLDEVKVVLPDTGFGAGFQRHHVAKILGANSQSSTNRIYFSFRYLQNTWLPSTRLGHGFAFVGLPSKSYSCHDEEIGLDGPDKRHLFVEMSPTSAGSSWHYFGLYEFSLVPPPFLDRSITTEEWNALSSQFRNSYTSMAAGGYVKSAREVDQGYSSGTMLCPLRLARCIGFDETVYKCLVDNKKLPETYVQPSEPKGKSAPKLKSKPKSKETPKRSATRPAATRSSKRRGVGEDHASLKAVDVEEDSLVGEESEEENPDITLL